MSRIALTGSAFLVALATGAIVFASAAGADTRLRPVAAMPDDQLVLMSTSSARAFDHIQAAREHIQARQWVDARQDLAKARALLIDVREASPATRVQDAIAQVLRELEDPTTVVKMKDLGPVWNAIEATNDRDAYAATHRFVSRARFQLYHGNQDAAARELVAASARVPYATIDGPIQSTWELVNRAMIQLYDKELEAADQTLAAALADARTVVRIASGAHDDMLGDVAAPPPPAPLTEARPSQADEIEAAPEFGEPTDTGEAETPPVDAAPPEGDAEETGETAEAAEPAPPADPTEPAGEAATDAMGEAAEQAPAAEEEAPAEEAPGAEETAPEPEQEIEPTT